MGVREGGKSRFKDCYSNQKWKRGTLFNPFGRDNHPGVDFIKSFKMVFETPKRYFGA